MLAAVGDWRGSALARGAATSEKRLRETVDVVVPAADVGDAALVADDEDFGAALDGGAVFAAGGGGAAGSCLREDDFAYAAVVADAVADVGDDAGHLGLFGGEDALAREEELEEDGPEKGGSSKAADNCQQQNHRREEDGVAVQQVSRCAEPAEEGRDGESVDGRQAM